MANPKWGSNPMIPCSENGDVD